MGTVTQCLCQGLVRMGASHFFFVLCLTAQALSSPLHTVYLPYLQHPVVYPWLSPVVRSEGPEGPMPAVEPVVVEIETEFICTTNGSFPDPESCHKYYVCNIMPDGDLKEFVFDCPPGLSFHAENGRCDWPTSEDCKHQVSVVACSSLEGEEARTLCQERLNLEVSPVVIELESFQFDCPPGLLFNAVEGGCDYAESVDCGVQEMIEVDVCTGPELSEEQRTLCQSNAWKHTDHF